MPTERIVTIEYSDNGVKIYKNTPIRGTMLLYESKTSKEIPEHMSIHLNYSKVEIINNL